MDWNLIGIIIAAACVGALLLTIFLLSQPDEDIDPVIDRANKTIKDIEDEIKRLKK